MVSLKIKFSSISLIADVIKNYADDTILKKFIHIFLHI
jgi:hypothetical protein